MKIETRGDPRLARKNASSDIMNAAAACLIAGDGDFEMSEVARKAGVSEGLAYHYFGSKAGLLSALVEDFYDRYSAISNKRYDRDIPWAVREKTRLKAVIDFLYSDPLADVILGKMGRTAQVANVEAARHHEMIELAGRNIRDGIERGQISAAVDPNIAGAAVTGAIRQAFNYVMAAKKRPSPKALTEQIWKLIAGALDLS